MDPISTAALVLRNTQGLSEHASLIIAAGQMIYKFLTEKEKSQPIVDCGSPRYRDKERYTRLCAARHSLLEVGQKIPDEWLLDENNCPRIKVDFITNANSFQEHVNALDICSYPQRTAVSGILEIIVKVFTSLAQKQASLITKVNATFFKWKGYRNDSYEVMFFSDLAIWLCITLPRYDIKDVQTPMLINKWIDYCKLVQKQVITFRDDTNNSDSPKALLDIIIRELIILQYNVSEAQKTASFYERMEHIDTDILSLSKHIFSFQHLLIEDQSCNTVTANPCINVIQFLEHRNPNKFTKLNQNLSNLVNTLLGGWLVETMMFAGIKSCDFKNTIEINSLAIPHHLSTNLTDFRDLKKSGLWRFARKDNALAIQYLAEIAEIYRYVIKLYLIRDLINLSSTVSRKLGDAWAYGDHEGKQRILAILSITKHVTEILGKMLNDFWKKFYEEHYLPENKDKDNIDICYNYLDKADALIIKTQSDIKKIQANVKLISDQISSYEAQSGKIERDLNNITNKLLALYKLENLEFPDLPRSSKIENRPIVIERYRYLSHAGEITSEKEIIIDISVDQCPAFLKTQELLESFKANKIDSRYMPLTLKESEIKSDIQKCIYNSLIKPYYGAVYNWNIISMFYGLQWNKIEDFRKLYFFACHVMSLFYPTNQSEITEFSQIDVNLVDLKLLDTIDEILKKIELELPIYFHVQPFETTYVSDTRRVIVNTTANWQMLMSKIGNQLLCRELESYRQCLVDREKQEELIKTMKLAIAELQEERQLLKAQIEEKDGIIAEKDGVIAEQSSVIAEQDGIIAEQDGIIAKKDGIIAEKESENIQLREIISEKERENAQLTEIFSEKERGNAQLAEIMSNNKKFFEETQGKMKGNSESKKSKRIIDFSLFSSSTSSKSHTTDTRNENEMVNLKCSGLKKEAR